MANNPFEELLRDPETNFAVEDKEWMRNALDVLYDLEDEYLVTLLRLTITVCSIRIVGKGWREFPSFELGAHGNKRVLELTRESMDG